MNNVSLKDYIEGLYFKNYVDNIPAELIKELLTILEEKIKNLDDISKLFTIQYSYFIKSSGKWIQKNLVDIGNESVSDIKLIINDNFTGIHVYSKNEKYDSIFINKLLDTRKKSKKYLIYAPDLYIDFEPQHFMGCCYTKPN